MDARGFVEWAALINEPIHTGFDALSKDLHGRMVDVRAEALEVMRMVERRLRFDDLAAESAENRSQLEMARAEMERLGEL